MKQKRKKCGRKLLSFLLTLAMVVGLMPGMSLTALAWDGDPYAALLNTTTAVYFDGKEWYLIEDNSTAANARTVTLLTKECVAASKFNENGGNNTYSGSIVETAVNNYYTKSISSNVKSAIVDNKMFLLTKEQANAITNAEVRKCSNASNDGWWLGEQGAIDTYAACVSSVNGDVIGDGADVSLEGGVRPALQLNLESVIFSSETNTFSLKPVVTEYPLWVGGEQVTSENASNIDGDNKASFDPETNTLTLNNYSYSGEGNKSDISATAGIYSNGIDLSIELIGTNTITTNGSAQSQSGIDIVNGNLTITARDNGSLTVTGGNSNDMGSISNGICVRRTLDDSARDSKLTIADGATVNAAVNTTNEFASGTGVYANDGLDVSGTLIADGGNGGQSFGVQTNGDVDVSGTLIATAGSSVAESYGIYTYKNVTVREGGVVKASAIGNTSDEMCKGVGIYTWTAWDESAHSEVDGKVIIEGGEVTASGYDCGIQSRDSVIIKGGKVTATAEEGNGIRCGARNWETGIYENGTISFEGGSVTASGSDKGVYAQNVSISDGLTAMAGDEAPGADVTNTFATNHDQKWVKVEPPKIPQDITAPDVTVTYGDIDKSVSASVTYPTEGGGAISYAVKDGSKDYIDVDATTGALTIKKVGTATVIVTAAETSTYAQATKEVTVTISKANAVAVKVTANNRTYDGTDKPLVNVDDSTLVGGEMYYAVTTENKAPTDEKLYTTEIPTKTEVGTYYIWYKVVGDENHLDSDVACVTSKILAKKEEVKPEPIVEPAPAEKIKLTVTAKDQTIAFGAAISQASSKYTIKGLQTGDEAKVTLKADMKKFTITPVVTVKNGDKDVTDAYDITAVSANIAISQVPMVAAISKGKSITATLTKIKNVDGYLIYTGYCGGTSKLVKTVKGNKAVKYTYKKINGKALDRKKASKVIVKAYRLVDGKKVVVATSMTAHVAGVLNKKLANASSVTVAKKNIVLKSGKTANVDAKVVLTTTKKAQLSKGHAAELRYASSNVAVATVDAKGKITAKGKGKCTVYAVAVDGTRTTVNVKVE